MLAVPTSSSDLETKPDLLCKTFSICPILGSARMPFDLLSQKLVPVKEKLKQRLYNAFQVTDNFIDYFDPQFLNRWVDPIIFQEISERIEKSSKPLKVLELACGPSYHHCYHMGPPWFSRSLKEYFADKIELTVSDGRKATFGFALVQITDYLTVQSFPGAQYSSLSVSDFDKTLAAFRPLAAHNTSDSLSKSFFWNGWKKLITDVPLDKAYVRPLYDKTLEKDVFNIDLVYGVNIFIGKTTAPLLNKSADKYDVVFIRNFPPLEDDYGRNYVLVEYLRSSVQPLVADSGIAIIGFDPAAISPLTVAKRNETNPPADQ